MKITLKELRSIIRESVRQYLNESDSESPSVDDRGLVEAAIAAQIGNDKDKYEELKTEIENRINKLELAALTSDDVMSGILSARIGNLKRGLMSPVERNNYDNKMGGIEMARELGFGAGYPIGPGGKTVGPKLEEVTMSLQELRSLVREAVRKQIKK